MVQLAPKFLTVDEFISHYGECDRYELIDGELIEIEATAPTRGLNKLYDCCNLSIHQEPECRRNWLVTYFNTPLLLNKGV
ncbi:hypothetical protein [Nostoc sp. DedQUE09]|uniref:hypothetical protein n=1 Tax=Nostoc sp. DedQUE09 TaxID=3075394 RepID=UPI002AD4C6C7|nr:hypothetical protein [Nostoc sp. DedQUE09]MDZ7952674.1 hypothetical protein [Nostoc sp. DedQUE09]